MQDASKNKAATFGKWKLPLGCALLPSLHRGRRQGGHFRLASRTPPQTGPHQFGLFIGPENSGEHLELVVHEQSTSVPMSFIYLTLYFNIGLFLQPHGNKSMTSTTEYPSKDS